MSTNPSQAAPVATAAPAVRTSLGAGCKHCGSPIPDDGSARAEFCCAGCETVFGLLVGNDLTRYYDLARGAVLPVTGSDRERSHAWLEPVLEKAEAAAALSGGAVCQADLDVQGIHCAACVWLMSELFRRREGGAAFTVNPALGKAHLAWKRGAFDVGAFVQEVEQFGYLLGPSRKQSKPASRDLVMRLGVCVAATMNVMLFSVSFYFGLNALDPATFNLFTRLSLLLAGVVVAVGGWPFFKGSWSALKRGVLHLDLPIALGILLVFAASFVQAAQGNGHHSYLDTLCTFVTLMLVGRWLQQRVLDRNRQYLLQDDGADGLSVRRREGPLVEVVPAPKVRAGDRLVIAPGDLVPVAVALSGSGSFSLEWITGEPDARTFAAGATVPAGAFNAGRTAAEVVAAESFPESALPALLSARPRSQGPGESEKFFDKLARVYVVAVLALAAAGFALWFYGLHAGLERAVDVAAALLVVTCPCAIGIAIPLAGELVQARLRKLGVLVRASDLLDRLQRVQHVVFDKTGTLTLGRLELDAPAELRSLPQEALDAAYDLASRSNHPVSRCLAPHLAAAGGRADAAAAVEELPGRGVQLVRGGAVWRLGSAAFARQGVAPANPGETFLARDGVEVFRFVTREAVRAGAARQIAALRAAGLDVTLLSGDEPARVEAFAKSLGLPEGAAFGGLSPEQKAESVVALDRGGPSRTLFIGDGVNDSLAFAAALCAGTPAIDRPVMPGKADFFLLGEDLGTLGELLLSASRLRAVVRNILAIAFAYNALAIAVCLSGLMTPLAAAIAMPASSISILLYAAGALAGSRSTTGRLDPSGSARLLQGVHA
jgi:Cu2+-exporting ATPase